MNPNDTHREQLSALIDGALDADQRRFLLRRLQHDGELTDSLSRWQMVGDVLRGQAEAPAPAGFAEAIATRIADEPLPLIEDGGIDMPVRNASASEVASKAVVARGARWRWFGGGALAASLVIASVLALRPDTSPVASATFATNEAASVSYTHLDVYKRQLLRRAATAGRLASSFTFLANSSLARAKAPSMNFCSRSCSVTSKPL